MATRPTPEQIPKEILTALGITQADVFIVRHATDGAITIITNNARKLTYTYPQPVVPPFLPTPPLASLEAPQAPTEETDTAGILDVLQERGTPGRRRRHREHEETG